MDQLLAVIKKVTGPIQSVYYKAFNANKYATKKTIAQGMLDVALLTSNASHLKLVLQDDNHPFYGPLVFLISLSILLQVRILHF